MGDDAFVDQLILGIRAGPVDCAGIIDTVTGLEPLHIRADRDDHAGGVPA